MTNQGICPTGDHATDFRQCGYAGCLDLRQWANEHHYRHRLEESYKAENNAHIRGDGRWFVEVPCKNGMIYPFGGLILLAYAKIGVVSRIAKVDGAKHHQTDGSAHVFKFPVGRLDEIAAILKPRRRRVVILTPEQVETRREILRRATEARKSSRPGGPNAARIDDKTK